MVGKLEEDKLLEMKCRKLHKSSGGTKTSCEASGTVEGPTTESFSKEARSTSELTAKLLYKDPHTKRRKLFLSSQLQGKFNSSSIIRNITVHIVRTASPTRLETEFSVSFP